MTERVTLRPYQAEDVERFIAAFQSAEGVGPLQWFGYRNRVPDLRRDFEETGFITAEGGRLVVAADDDAYVGQVSWWRSHWGVPEVSWCWQIGILVIPTQRGHGVGTQAQQVL